MLTLSDSAAARLAARIHRGDIKPGERLTSERALAAELGVSRPALREALQALQVAGLVQVRQKSGWYVAEHRTDASAHALLRWMQLQPVTDVVMVRRVRNPTQFGPSRPSRSLISPENAPSIASGMRRRRKGWRLCPGHSASLVLPPRTSAVRTLSFGQDVARQHD